MRKNLVDEGSASAQARRMRGGARGERVGCAGGGDEAPRRGAGEEARTKTGGRGAGEKQRTKTGGEPRRADSPARKQRTKTGGAEPARSRELRRADSPARKKGVPATTRRG